MLDLSHNKIQKEGAEAMAEALTVSNSSLHTLNMLHMVWDYFGLDGPVPAGPGLIISAYKQSSTLKSICGLSSDVTELDFASQRRDHFSSADAMLLTAELQKGMTLESLRTLDINCNGITGEVAKQLAQAVSAHKSLEVFCGIPLTELRNGTLTELNLRVGDLRSACLGDVGAMVLGNLRLSQRLRTCRCQGSSSPCRRCSALSKLVILNLAGDL